MRRYLFGFVLSASLYLIGCHTATPAASGSVAGSISDQELGVMKARYAKLREQNMNDCLYGTPEKVRANQAVCQKERDQMAPLGNAIEAAELKAAQRATNP